MWTRYIIYNKFKMIIFNARTLNQIPFEFHRVKLIKLEDQKKITRKLILRFFRNKVSPKRMWCQPIEDFSQNTDDFLSSGFHQFLTEFNNSDNLIWEDDNMHYAFNDSDHSNLTNYDYLYSDQDIYNYNSAFNSESYDSNNIFENTPNFDQNLENLLLDNTYISDDWLKPVNLPEKTLLCSDSCDLFLKESSENLKFPELQTLASHDKTALSSDSEEKVFPCTYGTCQKIYAKPAHLKAHMRRHLGDKPYICTWDNCTWRFSRSDELARHRRSHSGVKPYKCCYCPKSFARSDHLAKHRKVHERKMASSKLKELWTTVTPGRPGRKPNSNKTK